MTYCRDKKKLAML